MTTLLAFIGLITLIVLVVKFINSSKVTITNSTSQFSNTFPTQNRIERQRSLFRLSKNYDCPVEYLEESLISSLNLHELNDTEIFLMLEQINRNKLEEAKLLNIHPDDTGYAIMETWIIKYLDNPRLLSKF
jgi:hypothetical protein